MVSPTQYLWSWPIPTPLFLSPLPAGQRRSSVSTITPNTRPPDVGRAVPPASPPAASQSARRRRLGAQKALSECTPTASHLKDPQNSAAQGNQGPSPPSNGQKHAWGPVSDLGTPDRPSGIALTQGEGRDGRNSAGGSRRVADPGRPGAGANHGGAARAAPLGTVSGGQAGVVAVSGTGPRYEGLTGVERAGPMAWAEWARVLGPLRFAADPVVVGRDVVDRLPWEIEGADAGHGGRRLSRSVLFVGNHTLYGVRR